MLKVDHSSPPVPAITDQDVAAAFAAFPAATQQLLLEIRRLIFVVAAQTPGVGAIEEALRWGQPSYLTPETASGSTIRLGTLKGQNSRAVLFVHCQSGLADRFRELYGTVLRIDGQRAVIFEDGFPLAETELRHCIGLALTHHLRKRAKTLRQR